MDLSKLAAYFFLGALLACETRAATLGDALDNTNLVWTTGGTWNGTNYPAFAWFATNSTGPFDNSTFDGVDVAISGNRNKANSESWLRTTVVGPGTLSFWWQVNSRIGCDLEFSISSVLQAGLAGEAINGDSVDWQYRLFTIPAGTNVLEWKYVKDGQIGNAPYDQGWLDQVIYTTNAPITLQDALNTCGLVWTSGGNANIDHKPNSVLSVP